MGFLTHFGLGWVGLGLVPGRQTLGGDEHLRGLLRNGVGINTYKKGRMLL